MPTGLKLQELLMDSLGFMKDDIADAYLNKKPWKSLNQLAREDHPYAKRHDNYGHHPASTDKVYQRSGKAKSSVVIRKGAKTPEGSQYTSARITYDLRKAKHLKYVFRGTKVMIDRDPIYYGVSADWSVRGKWKRDLLKQIRSNYEWRSSKYFKTKRVKS